MKRLKRIAPCAWAGCGAGYMGHRVIFLYPHYTPKKPKIQPPFWNEEKGGGL